MNQISEFNHPMERSKQTESERSKSYNGGREVKENAECDCELQKLIIVM